MNSQTDTDQTSVRTQSGPDSDDRVITPDGERTRIDELNTGVSAGPDNREQEVSGLRLWWRNLNLVLAGMYTGLTCYGTPNKHHSYSQDSKTDADKPESRSL